MSSVIGIHTKCIFDGNACPPGGQGVGCDYDFSCRTSAYDLLHCCRYPEKAAAGVDEDQEWLRKRQAVPAEEWRILHEESSAIMAPFLDDARAGADNARAAGRNFDSHLEFLYNEGMREAMQPWYEKRDAIIEKYNQVQ
jgi:hypothetical protein